MKIGVKLFLWSLMVLAAGTFACSKETPAVECTDCNDTDLIKASYDPQPYDLALPEWMPTPVIPADNPLTVDGVELGRKLFYDPILSADSTMSCFSCHRQSKGFTDGEKVSTGILGIAGTRSSMPLINLAFNNRGFFWDGRSATLEDLALVPIEDHIELADSWENVEAKLQRHPQYPALFRQAFGIEQRPEMTRELATKAIAQFVRTLVSTNSRFDRIVWLNDGWLTDAEERGRKLFFFEDNQDIDHPGCSHCHFAPLFTDNLFKNNGLEDVDALEQFPDPGRGAINNNRFDLGRFRVPTLRNIALTAPYMHDGRFATLEEVLDHYSSGGHGVENEDVNIRPFPLTDREKQDMIAFLKTLTDTSFVNNPEYANPFK